MAYQPTFPSPYLTSIDVNKPETCIIKCAINPRDVISEYCIRIYNVDTSQLVGFICGKYDLDNQETVKYYTATTTCDYDFYIHDWETTYEISEYDSPLPVYGSDANTGILSVSIPSTILEEMSNGGNYSWKIALVGEETSTTKISTGAIMCGIYETDPELGVTYWHPSPNEEFSKIQKAYGNNFGPIYLRSVIRGTLHWNKIIRTFSKSEKELSDSSGGYWDGFTMQGVMSLNYSEEEYNYEVYTYSSISQEFFFATRSAMDCKFIDPPTVVSGVSHTFDAWYNQAENAKLSYYRFKLYCNGELIDDTNEVFSNSIKYRYDKFISGNNYSLSLDIEDEFGNLETIGHAFRVEYSQSTAPIDCSICASRDGYVEIDFSKITNIVGEGKNIDFNSDDIVSINNNGYIVWDKTESKKNIVIPYNSTTIFKHRFHSGFYGDICEISNQDNPNESISVSCLNGVFYYQNGLQDPIEINPFTNTESAIFSEAPSSASDDTRYIITYKIIMIQVHLV